MRTRQAAARSATQGARRAAVARLPNASAALRQPHISSVDHANARADTSPQRARARKSTSAQTVQATASSARPTAPTLRGRSAAHAHQAMLAMASHATTSMSARQAQPIAPSTRRAQTSSRQSITHLGTHAPARPLGTTGTGFTALTWMSVLCLVRLLRRSLTTAIPMPCVRTSWAASVALVHRGIKATVSLLVWTLTSALRK